MGSAFLYNRRFAITNHDYIKFLLSGTGPDSVSGYIASLITVKRKVEKSLNNVTVW